MNYTIQTTAIVGDDGKLYVRVHIIAPGGKDGLWINLEPTMAIQIAEGMTNQAKACLLHAGKPTEVTPCRKQPKPSARPTTSRRGSKSRR